MTSRREFIRNSLITTGLVTLAGSVPGLWALTPAPRPLKILILGGTGFIGPHIVNAAIARNHSVTLFNRGKSDPDLFAGVETIIGDRNDNIEGLKGREWDIVIDNSANLPRWVRATGELLSDHVGAYLFTSSVSVYSDYATVGQHESAPTIVLDDPTVEEVTGATYGGLKALSEQTTQDIYGDRAIIVRPTLIIGPRDKTDRFTYWPVRLARGGEVLAPGNGSDPVQFIDARDLANWYVHMAEQGTRGVFNGVGPLQPMAISEMLAQVSTGVESKGIADLGGCRLFADTINPALVRHALVGTGQR